MKTRATDRFKASVYLNRAIQYQNSMTRSFENSEWDVCVGNAVHCAISASDAYCVHMKGIRSTGDSHNDTTVLFASIDQNDTQLQNTVSHLSFLLSIKSAAEYDDRSLSQKDASDAMKHAERFLTFVKSKIK